MNSSMDIETGRVSPRTIESHAITGLRSLTWRHWRFALIAGLALGVVTGAANQLWNLSSHLNNVYTGMAVSIGLAVALLPLTAVASGLQPAWVPRWVLFAAAGALAGVLAYGVAFPILGKLVLGIEQATSLGLFWVEFPTLMTTAILAALGCMHWIDAGASAGVLHAIKVQRLRFARDTYEARLAALQARVEPDFLFAILSDIETLYEQDVALGSRVMDDLITHLRAALPAIEEVASSLAVEMALVETWLDIMRVRSNGHLTVGIAMGNAPTDARMPPMVLLPLVQHAAGAETTGVRAVVVTAALVDAHVVVSVVGPAPAFEAATTSSVIAQVRERVEALYGDQAVLTLQSIAHGRSQATLEVPYEHSDRRPR